MADVGKRNLSARSQPSRLQKRAPASIQIIPVSDWNVAIPLLSPLVQSPTERNPMAEIKSFCSNNNKESTAAAAEKSVVVMKKWQHPAQPFCYDPAPRWPFVCSGGSFDR